MTRNDQIARLPLAVRHQLIINGPDWVESYGYDAANRLRSLMSPAGTFTYTYNPGVGNNASSSALVANVALPNGAYITNTFDNNGRMLGTWLYNSGGSNLDSSVYTYSAGNQRTSVTRTGENTANYAYDPIGQVIGDQAYEVSGGAARLNEQLHYGYDAAWNLAYRTNNALIENFQVNNVNELTANTNGGTLTVMGTTTSPATNVTVNGTIAAHYADATFAATNMPLSTTYTAVAQDSYGRRATNTATVSLSTSIAYQYDGNGNLTSDGLRNFAYDDENQLVQVWVNGQWFSQFTYDGKMRRRIRQEFAWQGGAWVQTNAVYYVYDGNLVIQERTAANLPAVTYTRGKDLSGSFDGAGGIGGLLSMTLNAAVGPTSSNSFFYHCDGNGNVTMLLNPSQAVVAKYLYDAFGNILSMSGSMAAANVYRFSSKEWHQNSGLVYYLYRYYDPNLQRWPNRDPIGENGGINLYGFVGNNPLDRVDRLGLLITTTPGIPHVSNDRHNNYLIFYISCPSGFQVQNVAAHYDNTAMLAAMYQWYVDSGEGGSTIVNLQKYSQDINNQLGGSFGGIQDPGQPNCAGNPVEVHAYMRTRLAAPAWYFGLWRDTFGTPDPSTMIGLYQEYTQISWVCGNCCGRQSP